MTPPSRTARRALGGLALAGVAAALVWWRLSDPSGAATEVIRLLHGLFRDSLRDARSAVEDGVDTEDAVEAG